MSAPATMGRAAWRDVPALVVAVFFPVCMAWVYFVVIPAREGPPGKAMVAVYGTTRGLMFLFPLLYVWWFEPQALRPRWPGRAEPGLLLGLGFGLLVAAAIVTGYFAWLKHSPLAERTPALIQRVVSESVGIGPARFLLMALFLSVVHALFEEYYWRWFVFGRLRRYLPVGLAIVLQALGFALHHIVILYVYFPGAFWLLALPFSLAVASGGAVWAWLYARCGSLYATWLSHFIVDAALMLVGYAMLQPYWS